MPNKESVAASTVSAPLPPPKPIVNVARDDDELDEAFDKKIEEKEAEKPPMNSSQYVKVQKKPFDVKRDEVGINVKVMCYRSEIMQAK